MLIYWCRSQKSTTIWAMVFCNTSVSSSNVIIIVNFKHNGITLYLEDSSLVVNNVLIEGRNREELQS